MLNKDATGAAWVSSGCTAVVLALGVLLGDRTDGDWSIALSTWIFVTLSVAAGECLVRAVEEQPSATGLARWARGCPQGSMASRGEPCKGVPPALATTNGDLL